METQERSKMLGTMEMGKLVPKVSIPIMISMLVQALYNVVDGIFVAKYSAAALTAVSLAFPVQNLMIAVAVGTGVGINALLSKSLGEGNQAKADRTAMNGLFLSALSFLVFAVIGLTCSRLYFTIQTDIQRIVDYGESYMMICCVCSFGVFFQITLERTLQATGRTLYTMFTQATGAIINIILDPIMIFGLFGFPRMEVAGAALATVTGQIVAAILGLFFNLKKNPDLHLSVRGFRPSRTIIGGIYSVGIPSIVMQSIGTVMTMAINGILSSFSTAAYTVFGLYFKLQSFVFMPVFGLNQGLLPILGYNYGARNKRRMMSAFRFGCVIALVIMAVGMVIFLAFPQWLLGIFNASADLLEIGVPALRIICTCFLFAALGIVSSTLFQAVGRGIYSLIVSLMRQLVVLVPAAWLLAQITHQVTAVWWAFPIAECFSLVVSLVLFLRLYRKEIRNLETVKER